MYEFQAMKFCTSNEMKYLVFAGSESGGMLLFW